MKYNIFVYHMFDFFKTKVEKNMNVGSNNKQQTKEKSNKLHKEGVKVDNERQEKNKKLSETFLNRYKQNKEKAQKMKDSFGYLRSTAFGTGLGGFCGSLIGMPFVGAGIGAAFGTSIKATFDTCVDWWYNITDKNESKYEFFKKYVEQYLNYHITTMKRLKFDKANCKDIDDIIIEAEQEYIDAYKDYCEDNKNKTMEEYIKDNIKKKHTLYSNADNIGLIEDICSTIKDKILDIANFFTGNQKKNEEDTKKRLSDDEIFKQIEEEQPKKLLDYVAKRTATGSFVDGYFTIERQNDIEQILKILNNNRKNNHPTKIVITNNNKIDKQSDTIYISRHEYISLYRYMSIAHLKENVLANVFGSNLELFNNKNNEVFNIEIELNCDNNNISYLNKIVNEQLSEKKQKQEQNKNKVNEKQIRKDKHRKNNNNLQNVSHCSTINSSEYDNLYQERPKKYSKNSTINRNDKESQIST